MRILLVNYEYPPLGGGAGNATAHIAREMARQGHDVLVVTSAFGDFPRNERVDGFTVRRIPTVRRFEEKCASWEMAVFMATACVYVPLYARSFKPDACVAFFGIPSGPSAWVLKALRGVPYVVSLRGGDVPGFQPYDLARMHALTGPAIRFLWRKAGAVVPNSAGLAALARAFEPNLNYPVIPNGADTELFHPREEARRPGPVRLFFHGRVVYQKGLDTVLDALGRLQDSSLWELHIAGDGPQRPELETRARELGIEAKVFFRGWMRRPQLAEVLRDMDVFVFASRDEGMPNAVLEAMASGLPVVATRIAGNEELVVPEESGLLVAPDSPGELCVALARLIGTGGDEAQTMRSRMGRAGRGRVERDYSWGGVAARYLDLCARLASRSRRP
ncbi:glycosyltransferase family 4 protein [Fundidesulfovibrio terrae]|uniref:glycosyltransferase family 4 protein n=1 Tax=Fundidesulfovibrio terrae TaxID=2922866 RepID=UPI001FAFAD20|nr:glycosyltransferase family 4 protein [Fundidesulfovibrio terrae]